MKSLVKNRVLSIIMLVLFLFALPSCEEKDPEPKQRIFYGYFDTVCTFYDYSGMDNESFNSLAAGVESTIALYDKLFSALSESEGVVNIATLNRLAGTGPVEVSGAIIDLLSFSEQMYETTGGKVNFAMGAVTLLWKRCAAEKRVPTEAEIFEAGNHISPQSVVINKEAGTVEILDSECRLDLGAIAKGYTAELIKIELKRQGCSGLVLDMGGNLCTVGKKPSGNGWNSGIRNPLYILEGADEPYSRTVTIADESLVTSGVYERYYTVDGKKYHHIIDTETLMPVSRYLSVTVKTSHSGVADALSTAIFNMEPDEAESFVSTLDNIEVTLIFADGSVKVIG